MVYDPEAYASVGDMATWAADIIVSREPDVIIGADYMQRWWVAPRNAHANLYLHRFLRSDDDRALHDHPWSNSSLIIQGSYIEHTPEGEFLRQPGDFVERPANSLHRIELIDAQPVISLFQTGPKCREWGFACPGGWVHWRDFVGEDPTQVGRGCGEFA